jgi:kynurenine formamidase
MRIERIVDLSIVIDEDTPVFPGDPRPSLRRATRIETEGFNVLSVSLGSHTGTHVDAPSHVVASGAVLDELDLARFAGPGIVADVTAASAGTGITWDDLAPVADRLRPGVVLLLRTGWSERYLRTDRYVDHPFLEPAAAERVLERGVRTIGIDALNPDATSPHGDGALPVHDLVLGAGGVIAENLTNLSEVDGEPLVCLFPIRLGARADGAPCRAVALELSVS